MHCTQKLDRDLVYFGVAIVVNMCPGVILYEHDCDDTFYRVKFGS